MSLKIRRQLIGVSLLPLAILGFARSALAQDAEQEAAALPADERVDDDFHNRRINKDGEIVVRAVGLTQLDVLAGTSVVEGLELQRNQAGQVGEVLSKLPGVSATSFSPGASRPVLRGFSGERVKVLIDGIGAIDVSNTSADHAVSINPLTAESIEVLRGPAVMLYGSQAIGGAVNIIDRRIPRRVPNEPVHVDASLSANSASNLYEGGLSFDVPLGSSFVFHANGAYRKTGDQDIPSFVLTPGLRAEVLGEADAEQQAGNTDIAANLRTAAAARDVLPNSATETWSADAGLAFFKDGSSLGFAVGVYDTSYGVPERPSGGDPADGVSIGLRQVRADLRGELELGDGFFETLHTRAGFSDYTHTEFEGANVGTVFDVAGMEARAVLEQNRKGTWNGSIGMQYYFRDFRATGDEAYIPPNRTDQFALFALQEVEAGPVQFEFAGRYETTKVGAQALNIQRDFGTISGALSLAHETDGGLRFGVTGSRAERAPSAEELFSNGAHIATQSVEVGNPFLATEKNWGVEAFLRGNLGLANINFAVFQSWFSDYIYLNDAGREEAGLPVFEYLQGNVDYFGIEGEVTLPIIENGPVTLKADLRGDYIKAKLADGTPLPRIPPLSLLGALEAGTGHFDARAEVQWSASQKSLAPFETPTDSFTFVNASLSWRPMRDDGSVTIVLQADNIFDATGRRHASFTKDFVPLSGRNFTVSVRTSF
ncbi:MAG: TonB-dependent receptor [Pontixanthobacter sp.]